MGLANGRWTEDAFLHFLAEELSVDESEILSYDLNLYNYDQPQLCGVKEEILCSPRIDNLASVSALLESLQMERGKVALILLGFLIMRKLEVLQSQEQILPYFREFLNVFFQEWAVQKNR